MPPETIDSLDDDLKPMVLRIVTQNASLLARIVAKPPADMPTGSPFGPSIVALVTYFHTSHMIDFARLTEMLGGVWLEAVGRRDHEHDRARGETVRR